jgi:hypothetical protein
MDNFLGIVKAAKEAGMELADKKFVIDTMKKKLEELSCGFGKNYNIKTKPKWDNLRYHVEFDFVPYLPPDILA